MTPLDLLLDKHWQQYRLLTLLQGDSHPCKPMMLKALQNNGPKQTGTGLHGIADLLNHLLNDSLRLEDCRDIDRSIELPPPPIIRVGKESQADRHGLWLPTLNTSTILLYMNGSKAKNGTMSSVWHCVKITKQGRETMFERACQLGPKAHIEDGEIHAIEEGLSRLGETKEKDISLCFDNQNARKALAGRPTAGREDVRGFLEDVKILQQGGCSVRGKWTPSHQNIEGNEQPDSLANIGSSLPLCPWARTTLSWLCSTPYHTMIEQWHERSPGQHKPKTKPFGATSGLHSD
ncbi:hypothetical protein Q9L58_010526 [Maublancomyces gigas]|uniref:RNase H type-1 domain-containing protein n=1 Tax=Discina gigas TaxID=1032678 RepID=A0ABR3G3V2_9PEZI